MKKTSILFIGLLVALILVAAPFLSAQALDTKPDPIDPQSWSLWRDMTWETWRPNPVIDWMTELNPAGLVKPAGIRGAGTAEVMKGGVVLIDYLDRKFISRQPKGSDPLGFTMYDPDGGGMVDTNTNNPITSALELIADEKYEGDASKVTDADFAEWWADYLNVPSEVNQYTTVDSYYRENSYGQWAVDLIGYGPFTLPYFEFETMGYDMGSNFQTYRDVPPSFRRGTSSGSYSSFDSVAIALARDTSRAQTGTTLFEEVDFFFLVHAGYDESGVWQQFGMFQFPTRQSIPYELGPGPRMLQVEKFFTENPTWLTTYATRYGSLANSGETAGVAAFWNGERDKYAALAAEGKANEYVFKLRQADWDWVAGYNNQTQRNTRYVAYTCWEAAVGEWSHMTSASASSTGVTGNRSIRYSTQGESDGRGTFAHEFGHIGQLPDNYQLQWTIDNSPLTEPWEVMSGGQIAGPFGEHTRWQVPGGSQGDSVPTNMTLRNKYVLGHYTNNDLLNVTVQNLASSTPVVAEVVSRNIPLNNNGFYPQLEQYGLISPNYYKGIRLEFVNNTTSPYRDKATRIQTGWTWTYTARALSMGIEVVDQSGYDSYTPDHGVLLSRTANENSGTGASYTWQVIDSHLYDIALVDYMSEGLDGAEDDYVAYTIGSRAQLFDGAFHVGKSTVDTGYYGSIYDPADPHYNDANPRKLNSSTYNVEWKKAMLKPGSIMRWEEQDGRPVVSGDTVNEWHDPYNDLHIYILAKNWHDGRTLPGNSKPEQFLSYTIGMRHGEGPAVGGNLAVSAKVVEAESWNRVAVVEYTITNVGATATDIIRLATLGDLETTLLNDLYAIEPGETVTVPVYVSLGQDFTSADLAEKNTGITVSSETNAANVMTSKVAAQDVYQRLLIDVSPVASVKKLNGNKNDLTITVTETYEDGTKEVFTKTFSINNNAADTYVVGPYKVYVDTKGNDQIRACYVVK